MAHLKFGVLALAMAVAAPAMAQRIEPGTLTIDEEAPVAVRTMPALRRALQRCAQQGGCASIMLETCQMCILFARVQAGGYVIISRLGPPGPEYDLFDNRPGRAGSRVFAPQETVDIFTGYLSGRQPAYVGAVQAEP